jgi:hypothetical protein
MTSPLGHQGCGTFPLCFWDTWDGIVWRAVGNAE